MKALMVFAQLLVTAAAVQARAEVRIREEAASRDDRRLIPLLLAQHRPERGYLLLEPETRFDGVHHESVPGVLRELAHDGTEAETAGALLERLTRLNQSSIPVSIASDSVSGFVVDHERFVDVCFPQLPLLVTDPPPPEGSGGGWERLIEKHPEMVGLYAISRPAFDAEHGLVLVYLERTTRHRLRGHLFLYQLEGEELRLVSTAMLKIS